MKKVGSHPHNPTSALSCFDMTCICEIVRDRIEITVRDFIVRIMDGHSYFRTLLDLKLVLVATKSLSV